MDGPADQMRLYSSGCFFSSHSWHFFTVPPYSQYYLPKISLMRSKAALYELPCLQRTSRGPGGNANLGR